MYQIILHEFCNMGHLKLSVPISIRECLQIALDQNDLPDDLQPQAEIIEVRKSVELIHIVYSHAKKNPVHYKHTDLESRYADRVLLVGHLS